MKKVRSIIYKRQPWTGGPEAIAALEAMLERDVERKAFIPRERIQAALQ